uniref:Uncharacterized protein n=1 Tax=Glossina pallidipes TaxID=7398 RepID=A0A1A9ZYA6_GLOPL
MIQERLAFLPIKPIARSSPLVKDFQLCYTFAFILVMIVSLIGTSYAVAVDQRDKLNLAILVSVELERLTIVDGKEAYYYSQSTDPVQEMNKVVDLASPSSIVSGTTRPFVSGKKNVSTKPIPAEAAYTIGGITGEYKAKSLVINGAIIEPPRPMQEHKPIPVVRTIVGNISPAYKYAFGKVIDAPKRPIMAKTTTVVGFKIVMQAITKNPKVLIAFDIIIVVRRPKYFVIKTHKIVPGTPNRPLMNIFKNILPLNVDIN